MALDWRKPPARQTAAHERFLRTLADDTEDAPWMVIGDLQFWSASSFAHSLRIYARTHALPWYVASMLPIRYRRDDAGRRGQLAPDGFVAMVADHARESYDLEREGVFPAFVLEVVSPSSVKRDEQEKLRAYDVLGASEYVLFTPRAEGASTLAGYHRAAGGVLVPSPLAATGSLWSAVLGLRLVVEGGLLLAQTAEGERLRSPEQEAAGRLEEARARIEADRARLEEARARQEEARARQEEARARQEEARARIEADRARLEEARARQEEARARQEADRARQEVEAENVRLRQELARLQREGA